MHRAKYVLLVLPGLRAWAAFSRIGRSGGPTDQQRAQRLRRPSRGVHRVNPSPNLGKRSRSRRGHGRHSPARLARRHGLRHGHDPQHRLDRRAAHGRVPDATGRVVPDLGRTGASTRTATRSEKALRSSSSASARRSMERRSAWSASPADDISPTIEIIHTPGNRTARIPARWSFRATHRRGDRGKTEHRPNRRSPAMQEKWRSTSRTTPQARSALQLVVVSDRKKSAVQQTCSSYVQTAVRGSGAFSSRRQKTKGDSARIQPVRHTSRPPPIYPGIGQCRRRTVSSASNWCRGGLAALLMCTDAGDGQRGGVVGQDRAPADHHAAGTDVHAHTTAAGSREPPPARLRFSDLPCTCSSRRMPTFEKTFGFKLVLI